MQFYDMCYKQIHCSLQAKLTWQNFLLHELNPKHQAIFHYEISKHLPNVMSVWNILKIQFRKV